MAITRIGRGNEPEDTARIARVSMLKGALQLDPTLAHAIEAPSRRALEARGALYVLIFPAGQAALPPTLADELTALIGETYYELSGSITRGLRGAMLAANEHLFELNLRADPSLRVLMGAACAVIRQEDLYVAQMGPAAAIIGRGMDAHRYPDRSSWITNEQPVGAELDREPPLGLRRDAEPSLFHAAYRPEDLFALSSVGLIRQASEGEIAAACMRTDPNDLTQALTDLANGRDFALLVLRPPRQAMASEPAPVITTPAAAPRERPAAVAQAPALDEVDRAHGAASRDLQLGPIDAIDNSVGASAQTRITLPPLEEPSESEIDTEDTDDAYADPAYIDAAPVEPVSAPHRRASSEARLTDLDDTLDTDGGWDDEDLEVVSAPRRRVDLSRMTEAVAGSARKLRDGTENVLLGVLPREVPPRPADVERPRVSLGARALVAVALVIPLLVLFSVVMTRVQYDRARAAQHDSAINQAQYLYDLAMRQEDEQLRRDELYRAMVVIDQGLALTPENTDLQDLQRRAQHQIDQVEGVEPIYSFARLYYFEESDTAPLSSSRIAVNGKDVMVLNRGSDRIYRFYLNDVGDALQPVEANPVILQKGDVVDGVTVTDLVDLNYMASEGSQEVARFIALERSGNLLSYDSTRGMRLQPVANADLWLNPQAIGSYYGNLYVLDPLLGRLFKYLPSNNEYVKTPLDCFDAALGIDLTGAVDMAIDSDVYILFADGTIEKYNNGVAIEFSMRGYYGTMRSPVAIYVSGGQGPDASGYVYVADAGNNRVLQFTKDGLFVRQFRAVDSEPYMNDLRGLYVDEAERRMFLVSGRHFVMCSLPAVQ